jgi:phytoene desaturase
VRFHFNAAVERIVHRDAQGGAVRGVQLEGGERILADAVVCNADLPVAYRTLLPAVTPPRRTVRGHYSPSALLWLAGTRHAPAPGAIHHNLHFGESWNGAFRALLDEGRRMAEPSILVTVPTLSDPSAAPPGHHTLSVLEPVPNLDGKVDWHRELPPARERLLQRVAELGYPVDVAAETLVDPIEWERRGMERGTPFALSHRFFQSGPFRPQNVERRVPGLVFVGSNTVPGVGIPMVLVSGELAARRVTDFIGSRR